MKTDISEPSTDKISPLPPIKNPGSKYAKEAAGANGKRAYCPVWERSLSPGQRACILITYYKIFWFLNFGFVSCNSIPCRRLHHLTLLMSDCGDCSSRNQHQR